MPRKKGVSKGVGQAVPVGVSAEGELGTERPKKVMPEGKKFKAGFDGRRPHEAGKVAGRATDDAGVALVARLLKEEWPGASDDEPVLDPPRGMVENRRYRAQLLKWCVTDERRERVLERCRQDILFYIDSLVWQFNPKKVSALRVQPFVAWDYQRAMLTDRPETTGKRGVFWCMENERSVVVEKSRELGLSWLFLIVQDWMGLFTNYSQTLNVSRSADAVDCKSPDSLFWKIRFMHKHLPRWLTKGVIEQSMYFEYPGTESTITGEASTSKAGIGGRAAVIFIDEFSRIKEATQVREGTASTSDCRFFNGTHLGIDTEFYRLTQTPEFVKFTIHWSQHPEKVFGLYRSGTGPYGYEILDKNYQFPPDYQFVLDGSPVGGPFPGLRSVWYDKKSAEIGNARGVAMELDINPTGSSAQYFEPLTIRRLVETTAREPYWQGDVTPNRETGKPEALVKNPAGHLKLWLNLKIDGSVPHGMYAAGSDCSTGAGKTNSCLSIVNAETGEKVAEYATPFQTPETFALYVAAICRLFTNQLGEGAMLVWETNGPGGIFGRRLQELGYASLYYRETNVTIPGSVRVETPGWGSTAEKKRNLLDEYRAALDCGAYCNRSQQALEECLQYRWTDTGNVEHSLEHGPGDPTGAMSNHGDRVIADALSWLVAKGLGRLTVRGPVNTVKPGSLMYRRQLAEEASSQGSGW